MRVIPSLAVAFRRVGIELGVAGFAGSPWCMRFTAHFENACRETAQVRIVAAVLGLAQTDAEFLRLELLRAAREAGATAVDSDQYGERYIVDWELARNDRRSAARSAWIIRRGEEFPRSCLYDGSEV